MLILEVIERWSFFIIFSICFMPLSIWNYETGEYRGFFRAWTICFMLAAAAAGGVFSWQRGESGAQTILTLAVGFGLMVAIPRIWVECWHRIRFGNWLSVSGGGKVEGRNNDSGEIG